MRYTHPKPTLLLALLLSLTLSVSLAQNTILTTSGPLPGGGTGSGNAVIGPGNTYPSASLANNNVFIGEGSGRSVTTADFNAFVGFQSGYYITTGTNNAFLGYEAGRNNSTGSDNSFLGSKAGMDNISGIANSFTGSGAGRSNTTGNNNAFTGKDAGYSNTTGYFNSFTGGYAGYLNTIGKFNVFMGSNAGYSNVSGESNVFSGHSAGYQNTTGRDNSALGDGAGFGNTTGSSNTSIGSNSGISIIRGSENSFFGTNADATGPDVADLDRATALGFNASVAVNDGLVLGDTANVKVGIGTAYPNQRFTLRGNMNFVAYDNSLMLKNQPFLRFNEHESLALGLGAEIPAGATNTLVLGSESSRIKVPGQADVYALTLSGLTGQNSIGQFLSVDPNGKVVLSQPRVQVSSVADWSDKVFEEGYTLRPLQEVERFVKENRHLPGLPSAEKMVTEGMPNGAFNAKLLEKIEELTLYLIELKKENEWQRNKNKDLETKLNRMEKRYDRQEVSPK